MRDPWPSIQNGKIFLPDGRSLKVGDIVRIDKVDLEAGEKDEYYPKFGVIKEITALEAYVVGIIYSGGKDLTGQTLTGDLVITSKVGNRWRIRLLSFEELLAEANELSWSRALREPALGLR